ncbi:MAG: hypothetical protein Q7U10_11815 [Thermodesulfovibrionia bacterium]|nr:hypothetical protein [Thermodesulfovibrionia bacterium]
MIKNKTEKVLFKDILKACTVKDVKETLLRLYPDQVKIIKGYEYVFKTLKHMRHRYSKEGMVIDIKKVGRGKNAYLDVSGVCTEKGAQQLYALEYTPWSKWLGYEVDKKVLKKMPTEEIVAHCLWEMTFMGFTQSKIRSSLAALTRQAKDTKEGKLKTFSYEEVMASIKDKLKNG